jgi:heme exporter protein A
MENCGDSMNSVSIIAKNISKDYNRRPILHDVSFSLTNGSSLAFVGKNGAGKSTLSKIVAGLTSPTRGSLEYQIGHVKVEIEVFKHQIGFVSPYLNLYDEFTALENLELLTKIRGVHSVRRGVIKESLEFVGLWKRRDDLLGTFSSGMKQRLKYAFAILHQPAVMILDEPTSNLDVAGVAFVRQIVQMQKEKGMLIIATNDAEEACWCHSTVSLG